MPAGYTFYIQQDAPGNDLSSGRLGNSSVQDVATLCFATPHCAGVVIGQFDAVPAYFLKTKIGALNVTSTVNGSCYGTYENGEPGCGLQQA